MIEYLKAEVRRTGERVDDFEDGMRGRSYSPTERATISLSLRIRWAAHDHAKRKLAEYRSSRDAPIEMP